MLYQTTPFWINIFAACLLVFISSSVRAHNTSATFVYKFLPNLFAIILALVAFGVIK